MGQVGQLLQVLNQARPTPFAHSDDRDARIVYVVQLVVAVGVKARYAGGRQGPRRSLADNRDFPQGTGAGLYHLARLPKGLVDYAIRGYPNPSSARQATTASNSGPFVAGAVRS